MNRQLIIGCGSGRCGTVSLYRLLNMQRNSFCAHESEPLLTWKFDKDLIDDKLRRLLSREEKYFGDVSSAFLPYLEYIVNKYPNVKIVVLKRDQDEVVKSFMEHVNIFPWSHKYRKETKWDLMHPVYDIDFKDKALERYWEDYYEEIDRLMVKYPDNVRVFDIDCLNSERGILKILNFCGIAKDDAVLKIGIKENSSQVPLMVRHSKYLAWNANKI